MKLVNSKIDKPPVTIEFTYDEAVELANQIGPTSEHDRRKLFNGGNKEGYNDLLHNLFSILRRATQ